MKRRYFIVCCLLVMAARPSAQEFGLQPTDVSVLYEQGYYAKAALLCDQELTVAQRSWKQRDSTLQELRYTCGLIYLRSGDYEKAESLFSHLMRFDKKGKSVNRDSYARDLHYLGECYHRQGKLREAIQCFGTALEIRRELYGDDREEVASTLDRLGMVQLDAGNYDTAAILILQALDIRKSKPGKDRVDYAQSLESAGSYYFTMGDYSLAQPCFEECRLIREAKLGKRHPDYARATGNMAVFYHTLGQYDQALELYLEALDIDREMLGPLHPDVGSDINNLATLYKRTGKYQEALPLLLEACAINKKTLGSMHPDYATSLCTLAGLYSALGRYSDALPLYHEAKKIRVESLGVDHAMVAVTLNNLAVLLKKMGNYEAALPLYLESAAIYEKTLGQHHIEYAMALNNLGSLYKTLGRYELALALYEQALSIVAETVGKHHTDYTTLLGNLALLNSVMGNNERSILLLEEAAHTDRELLGIHHPDYAIDLINLGNQYSDYRHDPAALSLIREAVSIYQSRNSEQSTDYALALNSLSRAFGNFGKEDSARILLEEATAIYRQVAGMMSPDYAISLRNLAMNSMTLGDTARAASLLAEALSIFRENSMQGNSEYIQILDHLALAHGTMGNNQAALEFLDESNRIVRQGIRDFFIFLTEDDRRNYLGRIEKHFRIYQSMAISETAMIAGVAAQGYDNELLLKGLVLSSVTAMQESIREGGDDTLFRKYEELRLLKRQINSLNQKPGNQRSQDITLLEQQATRLEREISAHSGAFSKFQSLLIVRWQDISSLLKDDEAAIEFFTVGDPSQKRRTAYAYLLRKTDTLPRQIRLADDELLEEKIAESLLPQKRSGIDTLYKLVWSPIEPFLEGIQTVYFSPSGSLHNLSFSALMTDEGKYLFEQKKLVQLGSTRQLVFPGEEHPLDGAVVYGGIQYEADSLTMFNKAGMFNTGTDELMACNRSFTGDNRGGYRYLPGSMDEAARVTEKLQSAGIPVKLFTGTDAPEESFLSVSGDRSASVIHIATHGFYYPGVGMQRQEPVSFPGTESWFRQSPDPLFRSGLLFSGANRAWKGLPVPANIEDGILTAREVSTMNLSNTQLVVLSACRTGQGEVLGNEGVAGLQRGFKMAGVRYLMMSLRDIPDKETSQFMEIFYTRWLEGSSIRDAFQIAQLEMKAQYPGEPFKWAGFILVE